MALLYLELFENGSHVGLSQGGIVGLELHHVLLARCHTHCWQLLRVVHEGGYGIDDDHQFSRTLTGANTFEHRSTDQEDLLLDAKEVDDPLVFGLVGGDQDKHHVSFVIRCHLF